MVVSTTYDDCDKKKAMYTIEQFALLAGIKPANMTKSSSNMTKSSKKQTKYDENQPNMTKRKS